MALLNTHRVSRLVVTKPASDTLGIWSPDLQQVSNMYLVQDCPLVMSIGKLVQESNFGFHWSPSQLPYLQSSDGNCIVAHGVEHHVPVFRLDSSIDYVYLPFPGQFRVQSHRLTCAARKMEAEVQWIDLRKVKTDWILDPRGVAPGQVYQIHLPSFRNQTVHHQRPRKWPQTCALRGRGR